jgi:hypothetical protein
LQVRRIARFLETRGQLRERLPTLGGSSLLGVERSGDFADRLDVLANRLLLDSDLIQTPVDATG